jgi:hypothetical protein
MAETRKLLFIFKDQGARVALKYVCTDSIIFLCELKFVLIEIHHDGDEKPYKILI